MMRGVSETGKLTQPTHYQAYLVRLWRDSAADPWRVVVVYVPTGEKRHFASLAACFAYIVAGSETADELTPPRDYTQK
jgi:hypothetical protein